MAPLRPLANEADMYREANTLEARQRLERKWNQRAQSRNTPATGRQPMIVAIIQRVNPTPDVLRTGSDSPWYALFYNIDSAGVARTYTNAMPAPSPRPSSRWWRCCARRRRSRFKDRSGGDGSAGGGGGGGGGGATAGATAGADADAAGAGARADAAGAARPRPRRWRPRRVAPAPAPAPPTSQSENDNTNYVPPRRTQLPPRLGGNNAEAGPSSVEYEDGE